MTHISLTIQRDMYVAKYAQATSDSEKNFYMNVVLFIDSIVKNTGVDTLDCIPEGKRFLSGLSKQDILDKLENPVVIEYNGERDIDDDREGSLKQHFTQMKEQGYSLVACDVTGQYAFFVRDPPDDIHGVDDIRLLYRSLLP